MKHILPTDKLLQLAAATLLSTMVISTIPNTGVLAAATAEPSPISTGESTSASISGATSALATVPTSASISGATSASPAAAIVTHRLAGAKARINKTKVTLTKGDSDIVYLKNVIDSGWKSTNKKVATVTKNGLIKARGKGRCTVYVKYKSKTYTCRVTVEAPVLSKKSLKILIGNRSQLKLKGTKRKIKWNTLNNKIATVTSKGIVTGIGQGSTYITAKAGGHLYSCPITVKFDSAGALKKLTIENHDTGDGIISIVQNTGKNTLEVKGSAVYYDKSGSTVGTTTDNNYCLGAGQTAVFRFIAPYDSSYHPLTYASGEVSYKVAPSLYTSVAEKISASGTMGDESVTASVWNLSGKSLSYIHLSCLYFDTFGNVIGYAESYSNGTAADATDTLSFHFPYDENYTLITPASYQLYVDYAYH